MSGEIRAIDLGIKRHFPPMMSSKDRLLRISGVSA
jgi:hypothetical protein